MRRHPTAAAALALLLATGACSDDSGSGGPGGTEPEPTPGTLFVRLVTPGVEGAVQFEFDSPDVPSLTVAGIGFQLYQLPVPGDPGAIRAVVVGNVLTGPLVRFAVPDVNRADLYRATLVEVADPQNRLRGSLAGYSLTVGP